jgi:hypothetical protein
MLPGLIAICGQQPAKVQAKLLSLQMWALIIVLCKTGLFKKNSITTAVSVFNQLWG